MGKLAEIITSFERKFSCHVCFHDYEGKIRGHNASLPGMHINPFCDLVKKNKKMARFCVDLESRDIRSKLTISREPIFKICHMGVLEAAFPLFSGSRVSATMFVGPFQYGKIPSKDIKSIMRQEPDSPLSKEAAELKRNLPVLCSDEFQDLLNLGGLLARHIEAELVSARMDLAETDPVKKIPYFIDREFRHKLKISDLASFLGLSESRVCQILRKEFDKSFVGLLTERRVEHARHLLKESYLKTSTVAAECGFRDPAYFFRIFRKLNDGRTPGDYRREVQASFDLAYLRKRLNA
ncbi:MAG TPA: hypothetical protein DET40_18570 [Lentisphaeria bacterium]|nr:MAG: hypothetical protein A2X45_10940 [Lentisphaerae bacterium GWF2_50_93]HCE45549.1 hypothetical protein [Lentisphaeria bacterium]